MSYVHNLLCKLCSITSLEINAQELHNIAGSAQLPAWSQALGSDRDEREKEYNDSVEKLQQLFQSRIDLCSQAPKAEVGHLQSNVAPRGPEQDNQQLTSDSVDSIEEAISQSMVQLGQSEQVLLAFETTAIARAAYEHALASEKDLLQEVTASWQQCIDGSFVLIERSRQRQQLRSVEGNQQQAEAYIRSALVRGMCIHCKLQCPSASAAATGSCPAHQNTTFTFQKSSVSSSEACFAEMSSVRMKASGKCKTSNPMLSKQLLQHSRCKSATGKPRASSSMPRQSYRSCIWIRSRYRACVKS